MLASKIGEVMITDCRTKIESIEFGTKVQINTEGKRTCHQLSVFTENLMEKLKPLKRNVKILVINAIDMAVDEVISFYKISSEMFVADKTFIVHNPEQTVDFVKKITNDPFVLQHFLLVCFGFSFHPMLPINRFAKV